MKQYNRYKMDFQSKGVWLSGICMGAALFLTMVYYLFVNDFAAISVVEQIFCLWLACLMFIVYIALIRVIQWNAPGVYAILGVLFCVLAVAALFITANALRIVLAIAAYTVAGGLLILAAGGYLPGRLPVSMCFGVLIVLRFLLFGLGKVHGLQWINEAAHYCVLAALMFLPMGFADIKRKEG